VTKLKLKLLQVHRFLLSAVHFTGVELDLSVLEALEAYQEEKELQQQEFEDETRSDDEPLQHRLNRKMFVSPYVKPSLILHRGSITVSVLSGKSNPTSAYSVSKDALSFLQEHSKDVPRIRSNEFILLLFLPLSQLPL
jgi:hypothetical protein